MKINLMPYFSLHHLQLGSITIYTWGLFVGLGFCAGYFLTLWRAKKKNINPNQIAALSIAVFLGAVLGSRLGFLLQYPQRFFNDISLFWNLGEGGLTIWGGILGAIAGGWIAIVLLSSLRRGVRGEVINLEFGVTSPNPSLIKEGKKANFLFLADLFAPGAALGIVIGRVGCLLINDHAGAITKMPWAIVWPDGVLRHPVILYEILFCLAVFFLLLWLEKYQKFQGQLFLNFLALYAAGRFVLDFFRESSGSLADPRMANLTASQWISFWALLGVVALYFSAKKFAIEQKSQTLE